MMVVTRRPASFETLLNRRKVQSGDILVRDDGACGAGRDLRDIIAGALQQPVADDDVVGAPAERDPNNFLAAGVAFSARGIEMRHGFGETFALRPLSQVFQHRQACGENGERIIHHRILRNFARLDAKIGEFV